MSYNKANGDILRSIEPEKHSKFIVEEEFDPAKMHSAFKDFFFEVAPDDEDSLFYYFIEAHLGSNREMSLF